MTQAEIVEQILWELRKYAKAKHWWEWQERKRRISYVLEYLEEFDAITESLKKGE